VTTRVLGVGLAGELPPNHAFRELAVRATVPEHFTPIALPMALRRERKARVLVEAAERAFANSPSLSARELERCALVVVTRYDGQPTNKIDPANDRLVSFAEMAPTTVAFSFVSHMASSCVPSFFNLRGPAVTLGARVGLSAGLRVAERWIDEGAAPLALVIESDLELPVVVRAEPHVPHDYALAVLISNGGPAE